MPISVWSYQEPRLTAAMTPAGMPRMTAKSVAQKDSSTVAGNRVRKSRTTGRLVEMDVPKSPWKMPSR
ncbi:hypothetical protein D3C87_2155800 [compost metagenome]